MYDKIAQKEARDKKRDKAYNGERAGVRYEAAHAGLSLINHVLGVDPKRKSKRRRKGK